MSFDERAFANALRRSHGVITGNQLRRVGIGDRAIETLVTRGRLNRVARGVFVSPASPETFEQRCVIACVATGGVVMYPTAGNVWKARTTPRSKDIHVWVAQGRRVKAPVGVVVHRTTALPATDIVRRADGIAVTSPPRTMFDAAAILSAQDLESAIEQGIDRDWFTIPTLWATSHRLGHRGRAGSGLFASVLAGRPAWRKPVDSDHELRLERALRDRGFPPLTRQPRLEIAANVVIHPDLGLPEHGFYVEVDHQTWHDGRYDSAYDKRRDMKVRALGLHVERVSDIALDTDLASTVEDLWAIWQRCVRASSVLA